MLNSPKMQRIQRSVRINEGQLLGMAEKARYDCVLAGHLFKRCSDSNKWLVRWFRLYQNLLFYYDNEQSSKPAGVIFLEGCYCERLLTTGSNNQNQANGAKTAKDGEEKSLCFGIMYRRENQRQYELRADTVSECKAWIDAIKMASFNKLLLQKEELEQKHLHLLQVVESEKTAKWQYTRHCEDLSVEIKKLREELFTLKKEWRLLPQQLVGSNSEEDKSDDNEDPDISKIKKVQSFFRGWLCRRRWKQIVENYIKSPHAESMRKRNCLVFRMVEAEEEYVEQLEILISCFLRPFKMAASSKNPPCSHEDINSIFLNSETVLFLHQIFLKGLTARMDSWPTLVLGDLFDMLLPMLSIYQEYVRNHHYSLQVLTECKQNAQFGSLVSRLEKKPQCKGRSLELFLTYPMHQIPRYIITLHELLAHTPPDHVEKNSLEQARVQLEDLSRQMHDEVSETENIRKNLAIERMIVEGCDILLDVNQVFVRQGTLIQVLSEKPRSGTRGRLSVGKHSDREAIRQCFLFSNHLLITTRTHAGRLHLVDGVGRISLAEVSLIEDPSDEERIDEDSSLCSSMSSTSSISDLSTASGGGVGGGGVAGKLEYHSLDFKIQIDSVKFGQDNVVHLVAPTKQDKAAWITDISQCMDNVHFDHLYNNTIPNASATVVPQFVKSDPSLFKDDVDIRFSRTLNNCKVPQIRYATPERLLQRLTDLRFLSIDFLNTFLLTYRVFADGVQVLEALKKVFFNPDPALSPASSSGSVENLREEVLSVGTTGLSVQTGERRRISTCSGYSTGQASSGSPRRISGASSVTGNERRISGASAVSGYYSEDRDNRSSIDSGYNHYKSQHWRYSFRRYNEEEQRESREREKGEKDTENKENNNMRPGSYQNGLRVSVSNISGSNQWRKESVTIIESQEPMDEDNEENEGDVESDGADKVEKKKGDLKAIRRLSCSLESQNEGQFLSVPHASITASSSAETLTDNTITAPSTPTNLIANSIGTMVVDCSVRSRIGSDTSFTNTDPETEAATADNDNHEAGDTIVVPDPEQTGEVVAKAKAKDVPNVPKILTDNSQSSVESPPPPIINDKKSSLKSPGCSRKSSEVSFDRVVCSIPDSHPRKRTLSCSTTGHSTASSYTSYNSYTGYNMDADDADHMAYLEQCRVSRGQPGSHHASFSGMTKSGGNFTPPLPRALSNTLMKMSNREQSTKSPPSDKKKKSFFQRHIGSSSGEGDRENNSPLSSPQNASKLGVVITSARQAHRSESVLSVSVPKLSKSQAVDLSDWWRAGHVTHPSTNQRTGSQAVDHQVTGRRSLEYFLSEISDDDLSTGSWSSFAPAAVAFAAATAGSSNPRDPTSKSSNDSFREAAKRKMSITSSAATMRVLSVLRHWVTKHGQDFDGNHHLKNLTIEFLEDIVCTRTLLPAEHKAASQLLRMLTKEEPSYNMINLEELLAPSAKPSKENISSLSALEIAEQMTFFDQKILFSIRSEEFLGQAWMKEDKKEKAPYICLITERFNDMCRLIVSEIVTSACMTSRVEIIEKWAAVADICRCLHNFNGVLQVCAAFTNSSVFRLKETWKRVSKTSSSTINKLQTLVSSDGRHRNMRDALHRCDPPCIPYLGIYLSDLTYIEEGTANFTDSGLLNFAKMRMIAHVIREVRQFQQTPYKIDPIQKASDYLLDLSRMLSDDELYQRSLMIEPRSSRLSVSYPATSAATSPLSSLSVSQHKTSTEK